MALATAAIVGIAAASALTQFINSERGRAQTAKERKRLEKLINKLESPNFDTSMITPPELEVLELYTPEVAQVVYESSPELLKADSDRAISSKFAQDEALGRFRDIASGRDDFDDLKLASAMEKAITEGGRAQDNVLASMARQGISPSSSAYGLMRSQRANETQSNMFNSAIEAALANRARRDGANKDAASLSRDILGFETDIEKYNVTKINDVNERNTRARRTYLTNRANTLNNAEKYNIGERQRVFEKERNDIFNEQKAGRDLRNKQEQANYDTQIDKLKLKSNNAGFGDIRASTQDRNQAIQGLSDTALIATALADEQETRTGPKETREYEQKF